MYTKVDLHLWLRREAYLTSLPLGGQRDLKNYLLGEQRKQLGLEGQGAGEEGGTGALWAPTSSCLLGCWLTYVSGHSSQLENRGPELVTSSLDGMDNKGS